MQSNNSNDNKTMKIVIGVICAVVVFAATFWITSTLLKDDNTSGTGETTEANAGGEETNTTDENSETKQKVETSFDNLENTEENRQYLLDLINYDFNNYEVIGEDAEKYTDQIMALDTVVSLTIYNDDPNINVQQVIDETEDLINAYENLISKTIEGSFTSELNKNGSFDATDVVYKDLVYYLVDRSQYYASISDGEFDITVEPLVRLWDINNGNTEVPAQEDIDAAVSLIDYNNLTYDENTYTLANGSTVDFGAIAKGYMADLLKASLMSKGIDSALINLGGNVITIGEKPGGKPWVIGVQDPKEPTGEILGTVTVKNKSVVTSGNYERYFIKDGVRYHHILDPKTGYPGGEGLASTTIIADRSIDCDALSTTTFLLGMDSGLDLINRMDGFEVMYITEDMEYAYSDNFLELYDFQITKE